MPYAASWPLRSDWRLNLADARQELGSVHFVQYARLLKVIAGDPQILVNRGYPGIERMKVGIGRFELLQPFGKRIDLLFIAGGLGRILGQLDRIELGFLIPESSDSGFEPCDSACTAFTRG